MAYPKHVVWTAAAVSDFEEILDYLNTEWGRRVVTEFVAILSTTTELISRLPGTFMIINKRKRIRRCVLSKHYSLYYLVKRDQVEILRLVHHKRNPKRLNFL